LVVGHDEYDIGLGRDRQRKDEKGEKVGEGFHAAKRKEIRRMEQKKSNHAKRQNR
jgi:hypothetical protein